MFKIFLHNDWKFKLSGHTDTSKIPSEIIKHIKKGNWASVPGTVHTDLLNNKLIDEPFYSDNELSLNWIAEIDWVYENKFSLPHTYSYPALLNLVFEGIDTVAEIFLNEVKLGDVDNMFRRYSFNVTDIVKPKNNVLSILIHSPLSEAKLLEDKFGKLPVALNSERVYLRKAQYSFGWDWGPSFPTLGIWKPVYIEQMPTIELNPLTFNTINASGRKAEVEIGVGIIGNLEDVSKIIVTLGKDHLRIVKEILKPDRPVVGLSILLHDLELWYPNGEGKQSLYELRAEIIGNDGTILDSKERRVGIRKVELQLDDNRTPTFRFVVNGKTVFIKGVNWIPADSFLPRVTKEKYYSLLKAAKDANVNLVRVWGGGIYETDYFYDLCDELGLLVWQDFMFACGSYPEHFQFIENIKAEVEDNVTRLRHHACLAIWCGNNENEWLWHHANKTSYEEMPGYKIYHELIPSLIKQFDPHRPYWPSSPFGDGEDPNRQGSGNNHQWDIWSRWIDYDAVVNDHSLFVTEFGFQGPANIFTLNKAIPPRNRKTYDRIFEHHNKQTEGTERIFRFMASHLPVKSEWEDFIYLGQLNQGLALKTCIEHWRSNFPETNGTIIWQINDCWQVTSWALIDSNLIPKIAYHFVKNTFASCIAVFVKNEKKVDLKFINQSPSTFRGRLFLKQYRLHTGKELYGKTFKLSADSNTSEIMHQIDAGDGNSIYVTQLCNESKEVIHRNIFYPFPWKHATLPALQLGKRIITKKSEHFLEISSRKPALFLDPYHSMLTFSERGFSIMPNEKILIKITGKGADRVRAEEIKIFSLNDYLNG